MMDEIDFANANIDQLEQDIQEILHQGYKDVTEDIFRALNAVIRTTVSNYESTQKSIAMVVTQARRWKAGEDMIGIYKTDDIDIFPPLSDTTTPLSLPIQRIFERKKNDVIEGDHIILDGPVLSQPLSSNESDSTSSKEVDKSCESKPDGNSEPSAPRRKRGRPKKVDTESKDLTIPKTADISLTESPKYDKINKVSVKEADDDSEWKPDNHYKIKKNKLQKKEANFTSETKDKTNKGSIKEANDASELKSDTDSKIKMSKLPYEVKPKKNPKSKFRCTICPFTANRRNNFKRHLKIKHKLTFKSRVGRPRNGASNTYEPTLKEKIRNKIKNLTGATIEEKPIKGNLNTSEDKGEKSEMLYCYDNNGEKLALEEFTETIKIGNRYHCEFCVMVFARKITLSSHVIKFHTEAGRRFVCTECDYTAIFQSVINKHFIMVHEKNFENKCDQCDFATYYKYVLMRHIDGVHKGIKDYACHRCEEKGRVERFSKSWSLRTHIRTVHLKIKKLQCSTCGYKTNRRQYLMAHSCEKIMKENAKPKPWECSLCPYNQGSRSSLKRHMKREHREFQTVGYMKPGRPRKTKVMDAIEMSNKQSIQSSIMESSSIEMKNEPPNKCRRTKVMDAIEMKNKQFIQPTNLESTSIPVKNRPGPPRKQVMDAIEMKNEQSIYWPPRKTKVMDAIEMKNEQSTQSSILESSIDMKDEPLCPPLSITYHQSSITPV